MPDVDCEHEQLSPIITVKPVKFRLDVTLSLTLRCSTRLGYKSAVLPCYVLKYP